MYPETNKNSPFFYNSTKGQTEQALKKIGFKSLIITQPSLLIGDRKEFRAGESFAIKCYDLFAIGPIKPWVGTEVKNLANRMINESLKEQQEPVMIIGPKAI